MNEVLINTIVTWDISGFDDSDSWYPLDIVLIIKWIIHMLSILSVPLVVLENFWLSFSF